MNVPADWMLQQTVMRLSRSVATVVMLFKKETCKVGVLMEESMSKWRVPVVVLFMKETCKVVVLMVGPMAKVGVPQTLPVQWGLKEGARNQNENPSNIQTDKIPST